MFRIHRKTGKRILSFILVFAMSVSLLSGCSKQDTGADYGKETGTRQQTEQEIQSAGMNLAEQTEKWLTAQQEMTEDLSGETAKTLEERRKDFEQDIAEREQKAQGILKTLGTALKEGDIGALQTGTEQLDKLLVDKEEPKTYGDTLPNEAEVVEAEDEEYNETADATQDTTHPGDTDIAAEQEKSTKAGDMVSSEYTLLVTDGDTALNERITQKAEELGTPLAVYNYLKNNIRYEYYYGSRKGAAGTLDAMSGNDLDQASLLIAMLRHLGYPAEYVRGDILLTEEQALSLTGADTFRHAADVLAAAGTPTTRLTSGKEMAYIRVEHVWVRAYVPYTDYRGAGDAGGDSLWIDLDTGIKEYEAVDNIYDALDGQGFSEEVENITKGGDAAQIQDLLNQWEEELQSEDFSETYARKRIIKQQEISYLPLSLQYTVEKESKTYAQVETSDKDKVSFEVNGDVLAGFTASELQGKNILLSFQPASDTEKEIYDSYSSIFDIPAYAVYMKPVLSVDNEMVAEGEEYLETTLGTRGSFTINLTSGGKSTSVTNDVTTGSMYAVTLDSQSITAEELQSVYNETAALKDSVTEENVYSEEYLGKMLHLAGKLYFAQVDIADTIAADVYDVSVTRSLSEGITGYEVRTGSLYGRVTNLSEGSLYIDVDMNSHSVVSLSGDPDVPKEYMFSTGVVGSLYESTIWEEFTGNESVSTISILNAAAVEGIDILLISSANLDTEIEKLNTDDVTRQTVINAVDRGKIVTIPARNITMGDWYGTGYIVTNPETGAGAYMISGGLNGGSVTEDVTLAYLVDIGFSIWDMAEAILLIQNAMVAIAAGGAVAGGIFLAFGALALGFAVYSYINSIFLLCAYASGDEEAGQQLVQDMWINLVVSISITALRQVAKPIIHAVLKNKLIREFGEEFITKLLKQFDDVTSLGKYIKQLKKAGFRKELIELYAEKYGKEGLEWLLHNKQLGLSDDILKKLLKAGNLDDFTDDILKAIKNSDGYAEDIIEQVIKYGDDAAEAILAYGDDAVKVVRDYGNEAIKDFKWGAAPKEIESVQDYVKNIVDTAGNVDSSKMDKIRLAIQKGIFSSREIKLISKKMSRLGITDIYETAMKNVDFGEYLRNIKGEAPVGMIDPHAHHILFKTGNGATQQELVKEGQAILRKYGIDPIVGEENLVWAPNRVTGQHDIAALENVVNQLKEADEYGGSYEDIVEALKELGDIAGQR